MKPNFEPGDLVRVREGVFSAGKIGIVLGPHPLGDGCLDVLFHDVRRRMHPNNLQVPTERKP